jgi:predicted dehydrogenase
MEGSVTVFGEKGTVKVGGEYLNELEYQRIEGFRIENIPSGKPANDYGSYQGSMSNHDKVYKEVIQVLENGGTVTNAVDGMKTVEIIEKIYQAGRRE